MAVKRPAQRRRISDRQPLSTHKPKPGEARAFQEMVEREFPAVKGELSKRLAECFCHSFHVNAGERFLSMIEIFQKAMQEKGVDTTAIENYVLKTEAKLREWMKTRPELEMRRRVGRK